MCDNNTCTVYIQCVVVFVCPDTRLTFTCKRVCMHIRPAAYTVYMYVVSFLLPYVHVHIWVMCLVMLVYMYMWSKNDCYFIDCELSPKTVCCMLLRFIGQHRCLVRLLAWRSPQWCLKKSSYCHVIVVLLMLIVSSQVIRLTVLWPCLVWYIVHAWLDFVVLVVMLRDVTQLWCISWCVNNICVVGSSWLSEHDQQWADN